MFTFVRVSTDNLVTRDILRSTVVDHVTVYLLMTHIPHVPCFSVFTVDQISRDIHGHPHISLVTWSSTGTLTEGAWGMCAWMEWNVVVPSNLVIHGYSDRGSIGYMCLSIDDNGYPK